MSKVMPVGRPFQPGQSGNPGGRSKAASEIAKLILEKTNNGEELVQFALDRMRDPEGDPRSQEYAHDWLSNRCLGKPKQDVDVNAVAQLTPEQQAHVDALRISPHERRLRIAELKALAPIDGAAVEVPAGDDPD